ncbi:MBL fold metallo-hydrolase [Mycobacteroides abscessus]|uniref:MBL fold metallo-hydrolase n=2 Tax=Mycobacteroides abscessus TaxID=36809 RepID=UPI000696FEC7|nr:MBL fold metallo-hydrolase [Mycobacteroides abscessus]
MTNTCIDDHSVEPGYPGDTDAVLASVREIGHQLDDVAAVLLTHAHLDHIGAIPALIDRVGMPVYTGIKEVCHARRDYLQQITPAQMIRQLSTSRGRRWVAQTLVAVRGRVKMAVPSATAGEESVLAALPGALTAIPTPGHTDGHTAYLMASEAVLFSGDALITGHPLSRRTGPQLLPAAFNHDQARTHDSARQLTALAVRTLVPGHGRPIHHDPKADPTR